MRSVIPEKLWKALGGDQTLASYFPDVSKSFGWQKYTEVELGSLAKERLIRLRAMLEPHTRIRGTGILIKDINSYLKLLNGEVNTLRPRSVEHFCVLLKAYIAGNSPQKHLYRTDDRFGGDVQWPYYVGSIDFHAETKNYSSGERHPAFVNVMLYYELLGQRQHHSVNFYAEDCLGMRVDEALAKKNYVIENDVLRTGYLKSLKHWSEIVYKVGLQVLAVGTGTEHIDNPDKFYHGRPNVVVLEREGRPTRMVVDVFNESDIVPKEDRKYLDVYFWRRQQIQIGGHISNEDDETDDDLNEEIEDDDDEQLINGKPRSEAPIEKLVERPEPEVPVHTVCVCFDMSKHTRVKVHVDNLTTYEYDTGLADKLILPPDVVELIEILVSSNSEFHDIVKGKGGGSTILCAGPAGVGKTLTAECYAETLQRPLYSIQCSQLGIKPTDLENQLLTVFKRAQRWNAILLLDEADVYVATRGMDLIQNSIVGVFLRVLEYYNGTLFMTTNRSDMVDDAIASRCIARIDYTLPTPKQQEDIWKILLDISSMKVEPNFVRDVVAAHHNLSGRDIKNLIKLLSAVSRVRNKPIDLEMVSFVKKFKPTVDLDTASVKPTDG